MQITKQLAITIMETEGGGVGGGGSFVLLQITAKLLVI